MPTILIAAGESSGEKYGADLVHAFNKKNPEADFFGIGGKNMRTAGVELIADIEDLSIVGIFEVISSLKKVLGILKKLKKEAAVRRPDAAVLIDSPDFNLRMAKELKRLRIPVLYYISPTVWAWRKRRLRKIKKYVTKMMLIFPFEKEIYDKKNIPSSFIGHPLIERVKTKLSPEAFKKKYEIPSEEKIICLLPGSRRSEVKRHLPVILKACEALADMQRKISFLLIKADNISREEISHYLTDINLKLQIISEDGYEAIAASDLALVACGTGTLEAALLGIPVVTFYRISPLTYFFGVNLVKIKKYSIVNILAGAPIIPELIQKDFSPENILIESLKLLDHREKREAMTADFQAVRSLLGGKKASQNASRELLQMIEKEETKG